jgi:hypothetical protein
MENITLFVELNDEQLQMVTGGKNGCDRGGCYRGHEHHRGNDCDNRCDDLGGHHYYGGQDQCGFSWGSNCYDWHRHHSHHCHPSHCW